MRFRTVPPVDARYWAAITLASVFGANAGDFVSHNLHMGHIRGVPFILAAFVLVAIAGVVGRAAWEGWYWLAIVAVRTVATNLADLATHDGAIGTIPVCAALAFAGIAVLYARRAVDGATSIGGPIRADATGGPIRADGGYWLAMLIAGTFGTALGDGVADAIGLPAATVLTLAATAACLLLRARGLVGLFAGYWLAIAAIRTVGTNAGDLLAHNLTLAVSTPLTGLAMLALLLAWRPAPAPVSVPT